MPLATLRNGKSFAVEPGTSILNAALGGGLFLDYSCRTGRCGACKAKLLSGETVVVQPEESLTATDQAGGRILTCCRSLATDVALDVVDLGRLAGRRPHTVPARIAAVTPLSPTIMRVSLRFPPGATLDYLPGQYLDVIARGVRRSYSIANAPRADRLVELDIRRFETGALSRYWFEAAAAGDLLRVELPLGTFFLRDDPVATILFLATGTGIAPVRAMLEEIAGEPAIARDARLLVYWGNRTPDDFYWSPPPGVPVTFHPVLSRSVPDWNGRTGYVQDAVVADGVDMADCAVYACGSQSMIGAAEALFTARGLAEHRFYSDAFVSSASLDQS